MAHKTNNFLVDAVCRIKKSYGQPEISELRGSQTLVDDLGLDSLQLAELSVLIEAKYGIDVFANGIVDSVESLISMIEKQLCEKDDEDK